MQDGFQLIYCPALNNKLLGFALLSFHVRSNSLLLLELISYCIKFGYIIIE